MVHEETMCRLTQIGGSPKDTIKDYTTVDYSSGQNVVLRLMHSMKFGTKMESTSALEESGRQIRR